MTQKINRSGFNGKNRYEKEAYRQFLGKYKELDKTVEDPENFSKTDSSTFEKEELPPKQKIKKKSLKLKARDFFNGNWFVGVGVVVLGAFFLGGFVIAIRQSVQEEKINNIQNDLSTVTSKVDDLETSYSKLNTSQELFQLGTNKDLEYIKNKLNIK